MYISKKIHKLEPLLKYPGGKDKELVYILSNLPIDAKRYYEPFVGGGAVFFAINAEKYFINDISLELMALYKMIQEQNTDFMIKIRQIDYNWRTIGSAVNNYADEFAEIYSRFRSKKISKHALRDEISLFVLRYASEFNGLLLPEFRLETHNFLSELVKNSNNKILRMTKLEDQRGILSKRDFLKNIESAFKSAFYMHLRFLYNRVTEFNLSIPFHTALYFFIREFCYSSMFRYNKNGHFNVPYGGISYNKKSLQKKIDYFTDKRLISVLCNSDVKCEDFYSFLTKNRPDINDFMFLDPPYDTAFSTYSQNEFDKKDQKRLAEYLKCECECYFMLIIKSTDFILQLYIEGEEVKNNRRIKIQRFHKKYFVSFQNRNDKNAEHLIITNY